ncbi:hypothetical protein BJ165DRAFT_1526030 [Panaeolus papilionaceus]|nr:hypothetical protein BJ165DRAFT_1526030 [Panaeolus papilionaceus]
MSPSVARNLRPNGVVPLAQHTVLPARIMLQLRFPLTQRALTFTIDARKLGESALLLISLLWAAHRISSYPTTDLPFVINPDTNNQQALQLVILSGVSTLYFVWMHTTLSRIGQNDPISKETSPVHTSNGDGRPSSPRLPDSKETRRNVVRPVWRCDFGYVWMSVPKNYRDSRDDGIFTGLLLGPIIASAFLLISLGKMASGKLESFPVGWLIEAPAMLKNSVKQLPALQANHLSRYSLCDLSTFCSVILLLHATASHWFERGAGKAVNRPEGERISVPRSEGRRSAYYVIFTIISSILMTSLKIFFTIYDINLWRYLNHFEVVMASLFYQFALYIALRLAHRGFTLGEVGLVCFGGTAICLEFLNITIARIWPITTPYIRTYRLPTPLLTFQIALIVGGFLTGFLLSPFLVLSRNNAQRPVHRLRYPQEKERNRRYFALGFYVGSLLIVGGLIGLWTRWCLGNRDPWLWAIFYLLEGKKKWSRPALLCYWALLGIISVAGWNRQLARTRRFKPRPGSSLSEPPMSVSSPNDTTAATTATEGGATATIVTGTTGPFGMTFPTSFPNVPNLPNLPNGAQMSNVANDLLDAADKHVPTLGLNARRKFFHGLAVLMFVPGVAVDPAFTHLSFSAAFALFIFAEYIRYFAIWPFGASVHLFMNEFLDHRDGGTAILSHFYLLTGCAGSVWLEGSSHLLQFTGILTLGLGDAAASLVGRRLGVHKWSPTTNKTVEGSVGFVVAVFVPTVLLRLFGHAEPFSTVRYVLVVVLSSILEALSDQNDNLTLPLYMWSMLVIGRGEYGDNRTERQLVAVESVYKRELLELSLEMYLPDATQAYTTLNVDVVDHNSFPMFLSQTREEPIHIHSRPLPPYRKTARPSTAPALDDHILLPSRSPHPHSHPSSLSPISPSFNNIRNYYDSPHTDDHKKMQTVLEDDLDYTLLQPNLGTFISAVVTSRVAFNLPRFIPDSFPVSSTSASSNDSPNSLPGDGQSVANIDYDWATFIVAYADGRWDPHRTPHPPLSSQQLASDSILHPLLDHAKPPDVNGKCLSPPDSGSEQLPESGLAQSTSPPSRTTSPQKQQPDEQPTLVIPPTPLLSGLSLSSTSSIKSRLMLPLKLALPTHRIRNSFSNALPNNSTSTSASTSSTSITNSDVHTTVATMRWAAARVDISPLALPSPEHELTDPMRGVTAAIPGAHPPVLPDYLITPGGSRKSRLASFWEGTTDVDDDRSQLSSSVSNQLETIVASPPLPIGAETPPVPVSDENVIVDSGVSPPPFLETKHTVPYLPPVVPASAPALAHDQSSPLLATDYFNHNEGDSRFTSAHHSLSAPIIPTTQVNGRPEIPAPGNGTTSVPASSRRVCLTRQTSSPLPISVPHEGKFLVGRVSSESITSIRISRAAKEEQMFSELEYLAPPHPPNELDRRRALYKFNIWSTGPDANFDRIAHLAKLVFSTKGVMISLIDANEQWFKSEWGLNMPSCARMHSLCGHTILQRGDEPMIVLDTQKDWRFIKNPLATGAPHIRFYAGAPLRTQEGFNIGTLAVIDDQPKDEFSPRQRHTLKEFAAIAMREMELWRDKIQLRIRDRIQNSMEQFSRECLEIDTEVHNEHERPGLICDTSMDKVYDRAAKLVKRTLDVEGVIVMDVSHCDIMESINTDGSVSVTMHHGDPALEMTKRNLSLEEYHKLNSFFERHPDGKISEGIIPPSFKPFLPTHIQYALTVPIFNVDKRPFALLCAYNANDNTGRFLEGHELSYLRAIGVIILSAVLKRRMILADKAKGLFISNISHELRTPLHGILAAAELLSESPLNHSQLSFLQTVQACGTSLVETVNHVLDFTKLSGNTKTGGVENVIVPTTVDLMQLVEEAVDGCWIGHRARTAITGDSGIGSVYSPPKEDESSALSMPRSQVETIVDIGHRPEGISKDFLKNQLFHPFSQENPLQTGTGLGLAIVSSIVTSDNVGGKVDVWSEEGVGTEIKVTFPAEVSEVQGSSAPDMQRMQLEDSTEPLPTVSLESFDHTHKGQKLLHDVLQGYLTTWWGFEVVENGDITILNDDPTRVVAATEARDTTHPFIILSAARGNPGIMSIASEYERIGGFCRILYKPGGPSQLRGVLKLSLHALRIGRSRGVSPMDSVTGMDSRQGSVDGVKDRSASGGGIRRNSEKQDSRVKESPRRPAMKHRAMTAHPLTSTWSAALAVSEPLDESSPASAGSEAPEPTISVGSGGTLLKSSIGSLYTERRFKVLVVEDNTILRNLLIRWLSSKGYDYRAAVDGRDGVTMFKQEGPFDVVLLDLSMPVLDGIGATSEIRRLEAESAKISEGKHHPARLLALTGMSSLEDKRRAFEAGVDGYLVKPVAFKTLDEMFHKLGVS